MSPISVTPEGMTISVNEAQPLNALVPIEVRVAGKDASEDSVIEELSKIQFLKAPAPIDTRAEFAGNTTETSETHPLKQLSGIVLTFSGISTDTRFTAFMNALGPMLTSVAGSTMPRILDSPEKASASTPVTGLFI